MYFLFVPNCSFSLLVYIMLSREELFFGAYLVQEIRLIYFIYHGRFVSLHRGNALDFVMKNNEKSSKLERIFLNRHNWSSIVKLNAVNLSLQNLLLKRWGSRIGRQKIPLLTTKNYDPKPLLFEANRVGGISLWSNWRYISLIFSNTGFGNIEPTDQVWPAIINYLACGPKTFT